MLLAERRATDPVLTAARSLYDELYSVISSVHHVKEDEVWIENLQVILDRDLPGRSFDIFQLMNDFRWISSLHFNAFSNSIPLFD